MTKLYSYIAIGLLFIGISSCKKDKANAEPEKTPQELIVGDWNMTSWQVLNYEEGQLVSTQEDPSPQTEKWFFKSDGTGGVIIDSKSFAVFKYSITNSTVLLKDYTFTDYKGEPSGASHNITEEIKELTSFRLVLDNVNDYISGGVSKRTIFKGTFSKE